MGFFTGLSKTSRPTSRNNSYFQPGEYIVSLMAQTVRTKEDTGQPLAIVEQVITEVLSGDDNSNKVGETVAWFNKLDRKLGDGGLTRDGERGMERVKAFLAEVLGGDLKGVTDEMVTDEIAEDLFGDSADSIKGLKLHVKAVMNKKGTFTNVYYRALPDASDKA